MHQIRHCVSEKMAFHSTACRRFVGISIAHFVGHRTAGPQTYNVSPNVDTPPHFPGVCSFPLPGLPLPCPPPRQMPLLRLAMQLMVDALTLRLNAALCASGQRPQQPLSAGAQEPIVGLEWPHTPCRWHSISWSSRLFSVLFFEFSIRSFLGVAGDC